MVLYFDLDNFLNDHGYAWCRYANEKGDHNLTTRDMLDWDFMKNTIGGRAFGFFQPKTYNERLAALPGAVAFLRESEARYGTNNVTILTATSERLVESKNAHIEREFDVPVERVIHSRDKSHFSHDGILVDDSPANVLGHIRDNQMPGILFNHNGDFGWATLTDKEAEEAGDLLTLCTSYDEVLEALDDLMTGRMVA